MIKMISGATRIGAHTMTPASGAFDAPAEVEARLVRVGVAEYCGIPPVATPTEPQEDSVPGVTMGDIELPAEGQETDLLDAAQMQGMTVSALKQLAEDMGIDTKKLRTKAQLIAAICDVPQEDCIEEDSELPPILEAGAPVV